MHPGKSNITFRAKENHNGSNHNHTCLGCISFDYYNMVYKLHLKSLQRLQVAHNIEEK